MPNDTASPNPPPDAHQPSAPWAVAQGLLSQRVAGLPAWVLLTQLFIGFGWLRAVTEKLIDPQWWTGDTIRAFAVTHGQSVLAWYEPFLTYVVVPAAPLIGLIVLIAQLVAGLSLITGKRLGLGLGVGIFLNLNFVASGAVTPSVFYLLAQGALVLWLAERAPTTRSAHQLNAAALAALFLAGLNLLFIETLHPAEVIEDPAMMFVFGGLLTTVACWLGYHTMAVQQTAPASKPARTSRAALAALVAAPIAAAGVASSTVKPLGISPNQTAAAQTDVDQTVVGLDEVRSLDGSANNLVDPTLGQAGQNYLRVAEANYADGVGEMVDGPDERYLSNRIFNDSNQNIFSENDLTHWSFVWGQFIDHTIGLREVGEEEAMIGFDPDDPLEEFTNDLGAMATTRSATAEGTGDDGVAREQVNTISSYIDGWAVYGGSAERLDWLRDGVVDGDPTNNDATLITDEGYLPTAAARPGVEAPMTDLMGRLMGDSSAAVIAGDVRVNENTGLLAVQTLFVREHNRIVDALPDDLDEETKFQIARRIVAAEQQYITYQEFLPSMGVELDDYDGYDPTVDPSITNEFATVGYRAHSQIHGEFEAEIPLNTTDDDSLAALAAQGVSVEVDTAAGVAEVAVPLNVAFGNPALLADIGLGNLLTGLTSEAAYANDGQIDNQLRSVLFQIPGPDTENPADCLDGETIAQCFSGVNDLGALDVFRAYDHGMPSYNDLRVAYGLSPVSSFTELTGEATDDLGDLTIDDPEILDFVRLEDGEGNVLEAGTDAADTETVVAERRSTVAARLAAIFGDVNDVDAFTGMVSEPHVAGTEFGELQLAMWTAQFEALRDGDRFFYGNDAGLDDIAETYGIDYRRTLSEVIADNSSAQLFELPTNAFLLEAEPEGNGQTEQLTQPDAEPDADADADADNQRPRRDRRRDR